jgi:transcriptional regulator with XRE-family HTH domain
MTTTPWIGNTIRDLREERGWTQQHLAGISGVHPLTILRIENAHRYGGVNTLEKLLNALDHELEIVRMDGDGETKRRPK